MKCRRRELEGDSWMVGWMVSCGGRCCRRRRGAMGSEGREEYRGASWVEKVARWLACNSSSSSSSSSSHC
jgi:hypothetical protein